MTLTACTNNTPQQDLNKGQSTEKKEESVMMSEINVKVNDYIFTATLENNEASEEFVNMMKEDPVVIEFEDYAGFEKVGDLGQNLKRNDRQMTTEPGDIVLYNGHDIVVFYGNNSWSYTKLGKIKGLTDWEKALGHGNVTIEFSIVE